MGEQGENKKRITISFDIDNSELSSIEPVYANHVQLLPTRNEIVINFGLVDVPGNWEIPKEGEAPKIVAKPVARVIVPHTVFPDFAELVERQYKVFLNIVGEENDEERE